MATNVNVTGTVKFFNQDGGFGYIQTKDGDARINAQVAGALKSRLVPGAEVRIDFITTFKDGKYLLKVTSLISVKDPEPIEEFVVLTQVAYFDPEKNFGRVHCGDDFSRPTAYLPGKVCRDAGIEPGRGMPIRAVIVEDQKGPVVTSFEWGRQVETDYAAANPIITEVGVLKYFDPKGYGFIVREDGSQIGFHIMGATADLRDDFKKKYRKGTTFKFMVDDYRGKPTALLTELVALAPEPEVAPIESTEAVALEATASVEDVPIDTVAEPEAKPAKAPRKKAAAKPKKISPKKSTKAAEAPEPKPAAAPEPESDDIAAMAARHCANGGGAMAEAFATATKH